MKKVKEFCKVLIKIFGVEQWEFTLEYKDEAGNADVMMDHRYKNFQIKIYKDFFAQSKTEQAETLIHEFCHFFNVPVHNLLYTQWNGKIVTQEHATDILEQCNMRAEKVLISLLSDKSLNRAYKYYIGGK